MRLVVDFGARDRGVGNCAAPYHSWQNGYKSLT